MKFATELKAIDPKTGELHTWRGRPIFAQSLERAQKFVEEQAGYLQIIGHYEGGKIIEIETQETQKA
jgi:hypothetical protein